MTEPQGYFDEEHELKPGFYGFSYSWDESDGGWGEGGYWDGSSWSPPEVADLPMSYWYGPFPDLKSAPDYAWKNMGWQDGPALDERLMRDVFRELCEEVLRCYHGQEEYDFSMLPPHERNNAASDARMDLEYRIQRALRDDSLRRYGGTFPGRQSSE